MNRNLLYIIFFTFLLQLFTVELFATHNRAGEITYTQISELTYEITVTTYTYTLGNADREELEIEWGDGTYTIAPRTDILELPDFYRRNKYVAIHTFPGPGVYEILVQDPNRNLGVENIPNSVNTVFSIKTALLVNPEIGFNNTPLLLNPPINKAAQYRVFVHNPGAFDEDGDSISYSLTACTGENGEEITGYSLPPATSSIGINEVSGDLVWNTPPNTGKYNVAIKINEWRQGVKIGSVTRDMQIEVFPTENHPPQIDTIPDICILAGDTVSVLIRSTDEELNEITDTLTGGPFIFNSSPATVEEISSVPGERITKFTWITNCNHIRKEPFMVLVTAKDNHPDVNLVGIRRFYIKVIGPAPEGLTTEPGNAYIRLGWNSPECEPVNYQVYRRIGSLDYTHDTCTTGLPEYTGYELVGETSDTVFVDNDNGEGLVQGFSYCYRTVAEFINTGESYPSEEQCASLAPGIPIMTNVSVTKTNEFNGEITVRWAKPDKLDTIADAVGPFKYIIYRSDDEYGMRLKKIDSISGLDDTTYYDTGLNTLDTQYSYEIALYNDTPGNRFRIGIPPLASSIFLNMKPLDNVVEIDISKNTPWLDNEYVIYRQNKFTMSFDSIDYSNSKIYSDKGLKNGEEYCYKVKSKGIYTFNSEERLTENWSHETCQTPEDFQRPCPPTLNVESMCSDGINILTWNNPNLTCTDDVIGYKIYVINNELNVLDFVHEIDGAENTSFEHSPENSLGGCYAVAAVDSFQNESQASYTVCVDNCSYFSLPNVFTPNGDNVNDIFKAENPKQLVKRVEIKIYNRWGELVFESNDNPLIEWDGKVLNTNKIVPSGVYYYICDIWEPRISGLEQRNLVGFIHVYSDSNGPPINNE